MNGVKIKEGWADNLKEGSKVFLRRAGSGMNRVESSQWSEVTVDRVTPTEVLIDGKRFRRGKGRSKFVEYQNEGKEIERLSSSYYDEIFPITAATRRWLAETIAEDEALANIGALSRDVTAAVKRAVADENVKGLTAALKALGGPVG